MTDEGYKTILAFDSDDPEFARAFEAGRIWGRMDHENHIEESIHASNTEMVMLQKGYGGVVIDGEWIGWMAVAPYGIISDVTACGRHNVVEWSA